MTVEKFDCGKLRKSVCAQKCIADLVQGREHSFFEEDECGGTKSDDWLQ